MPAQVNATLTGVTGATAASGGRDNYYEPEGPPDADEGAVKLADGDVAAYYRERIDRVQGPNGVDVLTRRTLIIDSVDFRDLGIDTDDVLTIDGPAGTFTARAQAVAVAELDGIPRDLATTRIELEPS